MSDFEVVEDVHEDYFDGKRFVPKLLADAVMDKHHFVTMMDNEQIYVFREGYYQPKGEIIIKQAVKNYLEAEYRKNRATEVIDYIKASTYTQRREESPHLIPVQNGILDISGDTPELKDYKPKYMFFNKLPVTYDPEAECPRIKQFHKEITGSEEDVTILEEVLGFCLYRDYFIAKALMLVGDGSNGKSTWLSLVKTFLGQKNVCGRSLQDLEEHRFAKANLHTKLANIYADLPDKALYRTGTFKILTGRDLISAEKKFQSAFEFINYAKLMFSANKVPEANDDTTAFFRRWIILAFPNTFKGEDADPHILDKLTTEEELSGLLNLALDGLDTLLDTGTFSDSKTTEEIREDYIRKSSPIAAFIMDCLEVDSDAFIVKKALYSEFTQYCRGRGLPTVTQNTFYKNLPQHASVADFRPRQIKGRPYCFKGLRYKADGWSNRSNRSRVFYTLRNKIDQYLEPYQTIELDDDDISYIKVRLPLDRLDRVDRGDKQEEDEDFDWKKHIPGPYHRRVTSVTSVTNTEEKIQQVSDTLQDTAKSTQSDNIATDILDDRLHQFTIYMTKDGLVSDDSLRKVWQPLDKMIQHRKKLVEDEYIEEAKPGWWRLTDKGRDTIKRLKGGGE